MTKSRKEFSPGFMRALDAVGRMGSLTLVEEDAGDEKSEDAGEENHPLRGLQKARKGAKKRP